MTIDQARHVERILKEIETFTTLPDKIVALHRDGNHAKVCNIACELAQELGRLYKQQLSEIGS